MQWLSVRGYNDISKAQHRLNYPHRYPSALFYTAYLPCLGRPLIIIFKSFTHALADKLKLPPVELKLDILLD